LSPDSIPQLSLGTAALVIFTMCAGFVLLRGMTRMLVGTAILGFSAWVGFRVWQLAPELSVDWTGKSVPWITNGLPIAAFLLSFLLIRKIAGTIARPFGKPTSEEKPRSMFQLAFRLILALIPTALIWVIGAALVHHSGSIAELRAHSDKSTGTHETTQDTFSQKLKSSVEAVLPASWLQALDPHSGPSRLTLAKLIAAQAESPQETLIDPTTGKPVPRAVIVNDPDLQNLAREGKFDTLLRHPLLTKALADPTVIKLLKDLSL
jgi:hypothetical protein